MGELNKSLARLQSFDLDDLEDVEACQDRWFLDVKTALKVNSVEQLTSEKFMGATKQAMSGWLFEARDVMERQRSMIENFKEMVELLKTEALHDKEKVIKLQDRLLKSQDEHLYSLKSTVETTVQNTVQNSVEKEIKSYSDVVCKKSNGHVLTPESLQKAVVKAIKEEDRSRNVMVFGLTEEDGEQLDKKVSELFSELEEKPRVSAVRIGRQTTGTVSCRPVKVNLASSAVVHQILSKSRQLKSMERRQSVYICQDMSPEERSTRKKLVMELKKITAEQPNQHHYIKNGKIFSTDIMRTS